MVSTVETKRASVKLKNASWKDLKDIFALAAPYKWRIMLGLSFLGISSSIFLLTPRVLGKLVDEFDETKRAQPGKEDQTLQIARFFKDNPIALVGVLFLGAVAIAARVYCMHTAGQLVVNDLRKNVFNAVLRQDIAFFDKNKVGEIVSRLSTDALIVGYSVSMNLSDGARALLTCLGSGGLMVYTSPALCKVMFIIIPVIVGTFGVFGRLQRKYTLQMQEAVAGANQVATERLSSVRTVRMLVAEQKELAAYGAKIFDIWMISRKEGIARGSMFGSFQFTGYIALSTILFYGSNLISQGLLTYGDLSSFCLYAVLCAGSLSSISGFFIEIMKGLGASSRLFELRNTRPLIPLEGGIKKGDVTDAIRFERVAFAYPGRDPLFHNISFEVPAGRITAVVGPSGSGKSTIANLLLRLYDPNRGRIMIDDIDLKDIDPSYWRRQIGTVGQNPRILILDEATSALDATSEYLVRKALNRLLENSHQTVLIIAHRLSTIKHADQIVVLDKGSVAERGSFEELMYIRDGIFKKLVEKQAISWKDEAY
ncbi:ABC transporter transmembrane region [Necator americanus]|uniref:ABC transporter transmembrane region n=1 Tax=Necator americanus TaxID=51031 RepID=W2SJY5_NECAM|nr:ABC transporter transmembrane region [Necator americanus]ETN69964.1 ABC transporter transmembrane region [Necator americanus]